MKKLISVFAALTLLVSMLAVNVSAASDIEFSISNAKGEPGDIVEVEVKVDKNSGTWGMRFNIVFDSRCFDLIAVENGEVFSNGEYEDGVIDDSGVFTYYAEGSGFKNNTKTGTIATLQLKILKAAPNGSYDITIEFPDHVGGYFFALDGDDLDPVECTVELTENGKVTVTGSDAESLPETTAPTETESDADESGNGYVTEMVTEFVTDADGEIVTDAEGAPVVTEVPVAVPQKNPISTDGETADEKKEPETEVVYVTDAEGEQVTEHDGAPVTEIVVIENGNKDGDSLKTIVLIVCIVAVAAAAALIAFVVVARRKNANDGEGTEDTAEDDNNDGNSEEQ